ncbi:hypothetical protein ES707_09144 [subsurface metagenome]
MSFQQAVEKGLVAVEETDEVDVSLQIGLLMAIVLGDQFQLFLDQDILGWQQSAQAQLVPFFGGKGGAFVQSGIVEEVNPSFLSIVAGCGVIGYGAHCRIPLFGLVQLFIQQPIFPVVEVTVNRR